MSHLFMCVSVWSKQCSPIRLFPERSRPPLPVYVNSSPRSCSGSRPQPILYHLFALNHRLACTAIIQMTHHFILKAPRQHQ